MKNLFKKTIDLLGSVFKGYNSDDCDNMAAVISFYALFSLLPLAMITVSVLAYFLGSSEDFIVRLQILLSSVSPEITDGVIRMVRNLIDKKQKFGVISAGILTVTASFLVTALERSLDRVFRIEKKRNFLHSRLFALGFMFLFVSLFAVPALLQLLQEMLGRFELFRNGFHLVMSKDIFFYFFTLASFLITVTVVPHHKVRFVYAVCGGIVFTILVDISRWIFRFYVAASWNRYDLIYDSFTVLIVLILWVYYIANIFLLCSELVARLQSRAS